MKEQDITDEQILAESREILENPKMRKCCQCAWADDACTKCSKTGVALARWMYSGLCPHYETDEDRIIRLSRERLKKMEREERKINILLTLCQNASDIGLILLEDIEARLEREYSLADRNNTGDPRVRKTDREWIRKLKNAIKEMKRHAEGMRRQYNHFIMPIYNKIFFDKETKSYDADSYDDHNEDAYQLAEVLLRYFDGTYNNKHKAEGFKKAVMGLSEYQILEENDYKRYNFKR